MLKTLGGDRLGSGNRQKVELHNYERSTHDLSFTMRTTMAPGVLVPAFKYVGLNGDTFTIDLKTLVRTMPAIAPLFGAYKLQVDVFEVPMRLYQGLLHNNMTKIGMNMSQVKLPKIKLSGNAYRPNYLTNYSNSQISPSSLAAYLGIRGIAGTDTTIDGAVKIERWFNAIPFLAYYDIFKNYYANKQEKKAYVFCAKDVNSAANTSFSKIELISQVGTITAKHIITLKPDGEYNNGPKYTSADSLADTLNLPRRITAGQKFSIYYDGPVVKPLILIATNSQGGVSYLTLSDPAPTGQAVSFTDIKYFEDHVEATVKQLANASNILYFWGAASKAMGQSERGECELKAFDLENIDRMRVDILKATELGTTFEINDSTYAPYDSITKATSLNNSYNYFDLNGLVVKTYQSDFFNKWLSQEWIDGIGGINEITAVSTESGKFTIDALNLAHKVYNMLNRVAVSGGTYEDWQEAVYGEDALRRAESPIYCGGMSGKIVFEEIVSTSDTQTEAAGDQPLGSLAGKGTVTDLEGGQIEIHIKEPSYIMGIMSITPYIDYSQGNDFDMCELDSINDLHKPALDEIGFQNLLLERAAWFGTTIDSETGELIKHGAGKLPAWMDYMTNTNKVYGDFAVMTKMGFMALQRDYEYAYGLFNGTSRSIPISDFTTYINPSKFNYTFANSSPTSQNFMVQLGVDCIARRKMSAKVIPNL